MKTHNVFSGVIAAGLTLAVMPIGCGGAREDYELISRPAAQAPATGDQGAQFPEATTRQFKTCIERGAARLPKSSSVRFDVEPNDAGRVVKVALRNSTVQDVEVEGCLREAIAEMTVPEQSLRIRSSGPVSGGERMTRERRGPLGSESDSQNPFVLWGIVEMVGVDVLIEVGVGAIAAIGTLVIPRKKDPNEECLDKYVACMDSPLGNLVVDKRRHSLCQTCWNICLTNKGEWPAGVELTNRWQSCSY
jgi:hypothetical protein